jgi:hypothetical protein
MKNGEANGKPSYIHNKKHDQLPRDRAGARIRVCPEPVKYEITDNGTKKGNCASQDKRHIEKFRKQVHDPEIYDRTDRTNGYKPNEPSPLF